MGGRRSEIHSLHATSFEYDEEIEVALEKAAQIIEMVKMSEKEQEVIECLNQA